MVSCFTSILFGWLRKVFFAIGLYGWSVAGLVVWLIWSHVTFQFLFQSIITTYHFNWHISAFKPRLHTGTLVDRLLANIMEPVRKDLQTKVTDAFVHLNTRAPIERKETVGKKAFFIWWKFLPHLTQVVFRWIQLSVLFSQPFVRLLVQMSESPFVHPAFLSICLTKRLAV